jgi:centrin-3
MNEHSNYASAHRAAAGVRGNVPQYGNGPGHLVGHNTSGRYQSNPMPNPAGQAHYGSSSQQGGNTGKRVRTADDLNSEEMDVLWFHTLDDAEKDGIDQSFSLFGDVHPDGLNFYDLRMALKTLGFDLENGELKSWMERFGRPPNDWRNSGNDHKAACHTVQLRMPQETYRHVAACLVAHRPPREVWAKAFAVFDSEKKGLITARDLSRTSDHLGKDLTDAEIQRMIQEADIDDRGGVDLEEFIVIMERSSRRVASFS